MKKQIIEALEHFSDDDELILMRLEDYKRNSTQIIGEKIILEERIKDALEDLEYYKDKALYDDMVREEVFEDIIKILKGDNE